MVIDTLRSDFARIESQIAMGPVVPCVTPEEIRNYLTSRYDFKKTMVLEEVIANVEQMLQN